MRASIYMVKGDLDKAIADYSTAIDINPDDAIAYNDRGNAYNDLGDINNALSDYKSALEIDPDYDAAKQNLILAERKKRRGF